MSVGHVLSKLESTTSSWDKYIDKKDFLISKRTYNLCNPFKYDLRCASLCGVELVFTKERREKGAQRRSSLKGLQRLLVLDFSRVDFNGQSTRKPELGDIKDRSIELPLWLHPSILYSRVANPLVETTKI